MATQLIPVFSSTLSNEPSLLCNARDLHAFLEVGKRFASWITERINEYEFVENQDYIIASQIREANIRGGHNRKDYHLTLDTAKELAMVELTYLPCWQYISSQVLKTPKLLADTAPDSHADFLCPEIENSMVGRAANTIPSGGICPPTSSGFERPTTLSKGVNSKYLLGHTK